MKTRKHRNHTQKRAAEEHLKGDITISEAAHRAGLTAWEMERYLVDHGFRSGYSREDLEKEMNLLKINNR